MHSPIHLNFVHNLVKLKTMALQEEEKENEQEERKLQVTPELESITQKVEPG